MPDLEQRASLRCTAHAHNRPSPLTESFLFLAELLIIGLGIVSTLLSDYGTSVPDWLELLVEALAYMIIMCSLAFAARRLALDVRAMRAARQKVDAGAVLTAADSLIDEPLRARLLDGTIRLMRASWLLAGAEAFPVLPRHQELPPEAFFGPEEAAVLFARGDRSVLVLSQ